MARRGPKFIDPALRREQRGIYCTAHECAYLKLHLARMRARNSELHILAILRGAGIKLKLSPDQTGIQFQVGTHPPTEKQKAEIRNCRELIISALKAERFVGEQFDHSALLGSIAKAHDQARANIDSGYYKAQHERVVALMDEFLDQCDAGDYRSLSNAMALWVQKQPEMQRILATIQQDTRNLAGPELAAAIADIFPGKEERPTFDVSVFKVRGKEKEI